MAFVYPAAGNPPVAPKLPLPRPLDEKQSARHRHLPALTGLRFVLAIWVIVHHLTGQGMMLEPWVLSLPPGLQSLVRGGYLAVALGHCGECHTPRNIFGGPKNERYLGGAKLGEGTAAPNLTPARLKKYGDGELKDILTSGLFPDGDVMGDTMSEVVRNTTSQLTAPDLDALIAYLRSIPALPDEPK